MEHWASHEAIGYRIATAGKAPCHLVVLGHAADCMIRPSGWVVDAAVQSDAMQAPCMWCASATTCIGHAQIQGSVACDLLVAPARDTIIAGAEERARLTSAWDEAASAGFPLHGLKR